MSKEDNINDDIARIVEKTEAQIIKDLTLAAQQDPLNPDGWKAVLEEKLRQDTRGLDDEEG